MIDLNKKYTTRNGDPVVLYEIVDNQVFGRWYKNKIWYSCDWFVETSSLHQNSTSFLDLVEAPEFKVISEVVRQYKIVKYFDFDIIVPVWVNYIATESNGNVIGFNRSPVLGCKDLSWNNDKLYDQTATKLLSITFDGDWRKSLMRIK